MIKSLFRVASAAWSAALVIMLGVARADVVFSVTGTANESKWGYVNGQSYTFYWTLNPSFSETPYCSFSDTINLWADETVSDTPTFTDCGGDGLTGEWVRPTAGEGDPYSSVQVNDVSGHEVSLLADMDANYGIGLQAGGNDLRTLVAYGLNPGITFSFPESYTNPSAYFVNYSGTHALSQGTILLWTTNNQSLAFSAGSLSIIPEPTAGLLLLLAGGVPLLLHAYKKKSTGIWKAP
ncbi:MAG: hypothetical protein KKC51_11155 [Verrucomicrobia bacterium]|nr:hypothetical protein [Verrucomicrobiota bacterium]